ncbi:hypothetical protein QQ73_03260 [Candidatus Endoriftia persephone str. Guaymas]|nr:hypothetical protein [Candidatus Endoriftia persephone str. Guaymas]
MICSVCFASLGVHASPPDINAFLLAAREGVEVLDVEESWRGMASLKPASMPLEDVELRMEFDNGGMSEGDYVVRLHPRSFSRMQAETQQWRARETMLEARYRSLLSEAQRFLLGLQGTLQSHLLQACLGQILIALQQLGETKLLAF